MTTAVAVLGAGAWGTALAAHLARRDDAVVTLWARSPDHAGEIARSRRNERYLPGVAVPDSVAVAADLGAVRGADLLVAATPVAALLELAQALLRHGARAPLVWLSKGFVEVEATAAQPAGVALAHQVLAPRWPAPVGVVSGPSFAEEVARGLPTAVAVAATDPALAARVADLLRGDTMRAYESDDLAGVEVGGAVKNVLAIAAGASDGLGFGHNARAALITRGLAETGRLSAALGGRRETLMGLAGLGDLVLTCTGDLSRNRRVGLALARGVPLPRILAELGHVAEGVAAARAVRKLAAHHALDLPIADAVHRVLHEGLAPRDAVLSLLRREPRAETE
ncbi:MAG TPA: NAD(P)H-dependent glycerol-3-phosphate dehydrogenase [Casimicrobiaceae bacterium]|nr:NAD(P)H-dependent glycerol-3-phosphate dehydrogenase [Casimicrobiaceae bacterium]